MMNLSLVGVTYKKVKSIAQKIANLLNAEYVDARALFDEDLVSSFDVPMLDADMVLENKETVLIKRLMTLEDTVISFPDDMFLSNGHYKNMENSFKILVKCNENDEILAKIEKFLEKLVDISVNFENFDENSILKILKKN
ncbi:MAG: hypothetical protein E7374_01870 [Clostridiales bacterium]|nr:hypothetical protein [Clostridiales bacterium]